MAKYKIEDLKKEAIEKGWELKSKIYFNLDSELEYICPNGHSIYTSYRKIRKDYLCPICQQVDNISPIKNDIISIKKTDSYRILAIDQSTKKNGYAIFDGNELIRYGAIEIKGKNVPLRIIKVREWLNELVQIWEPDLIVIEDIRLEEDNGQRQKGVTTYKILAELIGILEVFFVENNICYQIVSPSTWRRIENIKGKYRNDKKRCAQDKVKEYYNIDVIDDIADAILIGKSITNNYKKDKEEIIHW